MIFGSVGSVPFDRLVRMLDDCAKKDEEREYIIQSSDTHVSTNRARCIPFLTHSALLDYMKRAEVVVAHAGVGTIIEASDLGRPLVLVPRLSRRRESINDHQLQIASYLESNYSIPVVREGDDMATAIEHARPIPVTHGESRLAQKIGVYADSIAVAKLHKPGGSCMTKKEGTTGSSTRRR